MERYWLFYLLALLSEIIGTVSGFGSSILFVPIASIFFDFKVVLGITAIFHVFSNLSKIYLFRRFIDKSIVIKMGVPAIIAVVIGAIFTNLLPQKSLEFMMNGLIFVLAIYLMFNSNKKINNTGTNLVKGGFVSGLLAGLVGTGGAIRGLTLAAFGLEKNIFIATSAVIDLGVDSGRAIIYAANGYLNRNLLFMLPILLAIGFIGTWMGKGLLNKIPQHWFKQIVLLVILFTSLIQLLVHLINWIK